MTEKDDVNIFERLRPEYWQKVLVIECIDGACHDFTKNTNKEKELIKKISKELQV